MLPVKVHPGKGLARRDPAPSRLSYRLNRLWLRPGFRRMVNFGVPMLAGLLAAWTLMAGLDIRERTAGMMSAVREGIVDRPRFTITALSVPDVSLDLAEQIRVAAFVPLPVSSLEVNVNAVRERIEGLAAVERVRVRALASGVLEIRAIERVPVILWRSGSGLQLLDGNGVRIAEVDSRLRRPDLPLIAGAGAEQAVPEALALIEQARPIHDRVRGLVRVGGRRWDLVLDRDQVVKLPEKDPSAALAQVLALNAGQALLARDLSVVDWRDPHRPTIRPSETAAAELKRLKVKVNGEDA